MTLAFFEVASALPPTEPARLGAEFSRGSGALAAFNHLTRWRDMRFSHPFRDWTAGEFIAIGVALVVCLAVML